MMTKMNKKDTCLTLILNHFIKFLSNILIHQICKRYKHRHTNLTCIRQSTIYNNITVRTFRILQNKCNISSDIRKRAFRINNVLNFLDICQTTIFNEEFTINNIIDDSKRNESCFTKTPFFKPTFQISKFTSEQ